MEDKFAHLDDVDTFDILDEEGKNTGKTSTYNEIHAKGLLHRTVHVWVVNSKNEILVQKRSQHVRSYPSYWDNSAGGHILSGKTSIETAQSETQEELGLSLPVETFQCIFTVMENQVSNNGSHLENAFNDIYIVHSDFEIKEFNIETEEVGEVRWLNKEEFQKWIRGEGEPLVPHAEEYEKILEYLK